MSDVAIVSPREATIERAREALTKYLERAVEIITELAETSENDRVRLAAAESIADRAGLGKSTNTQVTVNQGEHEAARREAEEVVKRIQDNQRAVAERTSGSQIPLDTLIVVEGIADEVPAS